MRKLWNWSWRHCYFNSSADSVLLKFRIWTLSLSNVTLNTTRLYEEVGGGGGSGINRINNLEFIWHFRKSEFPWGKNSHLLWIVVFPTLDQSWPLTLDPSSHCSGPRNLMLADRGSSFVEEKEQLLRFLITEHQGTPPCSGANRWFQAHFQCF